MQTTFNALDQKLAQSLRDCHPMMRRLAYQMDGDFVGDITLEGTFKEEPSGDVDYNTIQVITCAAPTTRYSSPKVEMDGYIGWRFRVASRVSGSTVLQTRVF